MPGRVWALFVDTLYLSAENSLSALPHAKYFQLFIAVECGPLFPELIIRDCTLTIICQIRRLSPLESLR